MINKYSSRDKVFVILSVIIWSIQGCAISPPATRMIYEAPNKFVRLEVTEHSSQHKHSHPVTISPAAIARLLRTVTLEARLPLPQQQRFAYLAQTPDSDSQRAFSTKDVEFLSRYISQALQQATPLEEAVFFFEHASTNILHEITSGGIYLDNQELHLQIANYRHPTIGETQLQEVRADPLNVLARSRFDLVAGAYGQKIQPQGWQATVTVFPQHLVFPAKEWRQSDTRSTTASPPHKAPADHTSLKDSLHELHSLKEEGLISEQEFLELRRRLLNEY